MSADLPKLFLEHYHCRPLPSTETLTSKQASQHIFIYFLFSFSSGLFAGYVFNDDDHDGGGWSAGAEFRAVFYFIL